MRKSILLLAGASLLALSFTAVGAEQCRYSAPRNAEINAAGLKLLAVQIGPDDLVIHGDPGVTNVVVRGTACASNEKWLQDVKIEASRSGDTGNLIAHDGDHTMLMSLFGGSYAYLKLDVRVPQSLAIKLQEGSGDAKVDNVAAGCVAGFRRPQGERRRRRIRLERRFRRRGGQRRRQLRAFAPRFR